MVWWPPGSPPVAEGRARERGGGRLPRRAGGRPWRWKRLPASCTRIFAASRRGCASTQLPCARVGQRLAPNCTSEVSQPSALACEANTGSDPRLVLLLVQIEELHTRVDKLDDRLTGNLKEQSDSFAATAKGLDERLSRGVQVR